MKINIYSMWKNMELKCDYIAILGFRWQFDHWYKGIEITVFNFVLEIGVVNA